MIITQERAAGHFVLNYVTLEETQDHPQSFPYNKTNIYITPIPSFKIWTYRYKTAEKAKQHEQY